MVEKSQFISKIPIVGGVVGDTLGKIPIVGGLFDGSWKYYFWGIVFVAFVFFLIMFF
jgi:hypothetical protein